MEALTEVSPGFKLTKLGMIPNEWQVKKFKEVARIRNGQVDPKALQYAQMLLVAPNHIESNSGKLLSAETATEQGAISGKYGVVKGDIIYSKIRPYLNKVAIADQDCLCSADMYAIKTEKNIKAEYLKYQMLHSRFLNLVSRYSARTGIPKVNREDLNLIDIVVPPLSEQKAIADCLGAWDKAIDTHSQLIVQKEERKKGLMQQLLTGKKRLPGFSEEWMDSKLGDVTKIISRRNKDLVEARIYSVTNDKGFIYQSDHFSREVAGEDLKSYKVIHKGEFAYNPARINVGSIAYFSDDKGVISSLYVCFKTNKGINDDFLNYFLQLDKTKYDIGRYGEGGVRIYLWYPLFASIKIKLPLIEEQRAIAQVLNTTDAEINLLKRKIKKLKKQKKGLMQQLLTGKKRLNH